MKGHIHILNEPVMTHYLTPDLAIRLGNALLIVAEIAVKGRGTSVPATVPRRRGALGRLPGGFTLYRSKETLRGVDQNDRSIQP